MNAFPLLIHYATTFLHNVFSALQCLLWLILQKIANLIDKNDFWLFQIIVGVNAPLSFHISWR